MRQGSWKLVHPEQQSTHQSELACHPTAPKVSVCQMRTVVVVVAVIVMVRPFLAPVGVIALRQTTPCSLLSLCLLYYNIMVPINMASESYGYYCLHHNGVSLNTQVCICLIKAKVDCQACNEGTHTYNSYPPWAS